MTSTVLKVRGVNGDGLSTASDINIWTANKFTIADRASAASEPSHWLILGLGFLMGAPHRRGDS